MLALKYFDIYNFSFPETLQLVGEGEYNLNALKEIKVTDSYLGLDLDVIKCQNQEPRKNCTTKQYHDTFLGKCGCLPVNMRMKNKVILKRH